MLRKLHGGENLTMASCHMQVWEVPQAPQLHFSDLGINKSQDGSRNEAALVLRVANEDVAIIFGKWEQYSVSSFWNACEKEVRHIICAKKEVHCHIWNFVRIVHLHKYFRMELRFDL